MKRMIDSEVSDRIKYRYDEENDESHIDIDADYLDVPFINVGESGIWSKGKVTAPTIKTNSVASINGSNAVDFTSAIKVTGGFANVRTYEFTDNEGTKWVLEDYGAISTTWDYHIIGLSDEAGNYLVFGLGSYQISEQGVNEVEVLGLEYYGTAYQEFSYYDGVMTIKMVAYEENTQPKLYRHIIQLSGGGSADNTCRLEWTSSNNLQCKSLADLRTVLGNPQMNSYVASNPSGDLFGVVISPSTAQLMKVGATSLVNITSVSDTVTPL